MMEFLKELFSVDSFMPHGHCYFWKPGMIWLHVVSDAVIAISYYSIPFTLIYLVRKRQDLAFNWIFVCFAIFIMACGATHVMEIWNVWYSTYWLAGILKAITAIASVFTAVALVMLIPKALALPSAQQLQESNEALQREVQERQKIFETLQHKSALLESANRKLETFGYSVSHDLRAPLRAMQGFSELLIEEASERLTPDDVGHLKKIQNAAGRLDLLIRDLLAYCRVSTEELPQRPVDMDVLVRSILDQYPNLQEKNVSIQVKGTLPRVMGHESTLTQVISNLLANAVKFVEKGSDPKITVRAEDVGDKVKIWVEDNGIGIAPEDKERIFRIFEQVNPRGGYGGTGVGLAIVKKAVEDMGGEIGLESEVGKGARFWCLFRKG